MFCSLALLMVVTSATLATAGVIELPTFGATPAATAVTPGWNPMPGTLDNGNNFWANKSFDGGDPNNLGSYMTTSTNGGINFPAANVEWWGFADATGTADLDETFKFTGSGGSDGSAKLLIEIAGLKDFNNLGFYNVGDTTDTAYLLSHILFTGADAPFTTKLFTPTGDYGFYLWQDSNENGILDLGAGGDLVYFSQASKNTLNSGVGTETDDQHFGVVHVTTISGKLWIGVEDLPFTAGGGHAAADQDFQDLIFSVTQVPEPGTLALMGIGLVAMGYRLRRRFQSSN